MNLQNKIEELSKFDGSKIVTVGLVAGDMILTGKRRDNGLWTSPGGHMDEGETPIQAAIRETEEEAGIVLSPEQLEPIFAEKVVSHRTGKEFVVIAYLGKMSHEKFALTFKDPDEEIQEWRWVPIDPGTPELMQEFRHAKEDAILLHLGVHKKPVKMSEPSISSVGDCYTSRTQKEVRADLLNAY